MQKAIKKSNYWYFRLRLPLFDTFSLVSIYLKFIITSSFLYIAAEIFPTLFEFSLELLQQISFRYQQSQITYRHHYRWGQASFMGSPVSRRSPRSYMTRHYFLARFHCYADEPCAITTTICSLCCLNRRRHRWKFSSLLNSLYYWYILSRISSSSISRKLNAQPSLTSFNTMIILVPFPVRNSCHLIS